MPRYRIPYNAQALFVGPSPASGYHFLNYSGNFNNDYNTTTENINLISNLNRIQSVSFDVSAPKQEVKAFGNYGTVRRYQSEPPSVNLSFEYLIVGVRNEDKLGLYVNFPKQTSLGLGDPIFPDNYNVFLLSGFSTSSLGRSDRAYGYPLDYRDSKNFFLAVNSSEGKDFNARTTGESPQSCNVFGFGNCYLNSYRSRGSIGDFARASCDYIAENLVFYTSGVQMDTPALNPQTYQRHSDAKCSLTNGYDSGTVSALIPGDITIDIVSYPIVTGALALNGTGNARTANSSIYNWGVAYTGIQIESYDLSLELPRRAVKSITHRLPLNRKVTFPIKCSLGLQVLVHDYVSGSIENIFKSEENYDISVIIRNPASASTQGIAIRYDLKKATLDSLSYGTSIGNNKTLNLNLSTELSPSDFTKGLFISGLYNYNQILSSTKALIQENGFYILNEDGSLILTEKNDYQV